MKILDKYQEQTYAILRIMSGFLFFWHGTQKFFNYPIDFPHLPLNPMLSGAAAIELIAGGLILLGLFTRPAAFIASGTMAVAYWVAHSTQALLPIANGGEKAALFCFIFLFIATRGAGIWSLDKKD
jgi:putative oxidoreductase